MSLKQATPRLGRGLAALMGDITPLAPPSGIRMVAIEALQASPYQPRGDMDASALAELTDSIREHGILQPLLARIHPTEKGHYQIIAGERRWRAAQAAGLHDIPVLVRELGDLEAMAAGLVENLQRQDLNPVEEAEGFRRLTEEFGISQEAIGRSVGKSRSHVSNTLRLLGLPQSLLAELRTGRISAGHARALLMHPEPEAALASVLSRGLNVRQTEALVKMPRQPRIQKASDPDTVALEQGVSERLGLKVDIGFNGSGGVMKIHYRDLEQLEGLLALLSK